MDKSRRIAWGVLALYAAILFWSLHRTPLWLDEIQQFANSRHTTVAELLRWVQLNAGASPLPYLVQHAFTSLFGYSSWAARFPAAVCSVLAGAVFASVCPLVLQRGHSIALLLFLTLPVQFRYGIEARVYSQGLLFSLLTFLLFLLIKERPSRNLLVLYGIFVAASLYSQPLTVFPVLAQMIFARRATIIAAGAGIASYLPWFLAQRQAQLEYAHLIPPRPFFSLSQIYPRAVLHDLTGGGYLTTLTLIALAALALWSVPKPRLTLAILAISIAGPIAMDVIFNYFFAERQLLYAMPALVLLAAQGFERIRLTSYNAVACALAGVFLVSASIKDFRQAVTPRDNLAGTADAILANLGPKACVIAAPPEQIAFYSFFHPELEARVCPKDPDSEEVVAGISGYTTSSERKTLMNAMAARFDGHEEIPIGDSEAIVFRRR